MHKFNQQLYSKYAAYYTSIGIIITLLFIGINEVLSFLVTNSLINHQYDLFPIVLKEFINIILGLIIMFFNIKFFNISIYRKFSFILVIISFLLSLAVFSPLGKTVQGNTNWIHIQHIWLQPSELLQASLILWGSHTLSKYNTKTDKNTLLLFLFVFLSSMILILFMHDLGTTLILFAIFISFYLFLDKCPKLYSYIIQSIIFAFIILVIITPYRLMRIKNFIHPFQHTSDINYQIIHSFAAISRGHILGVGIGNSIEKFGYLPNGDTDFILSIIGEENGIFGLILILFLFSLLCFILFVNVIKYQKNRFTQLFVTISTIWIMIKCYISYSVILGLLPVIGLGMPLISYGGSSLIATIFILSIVLNIINKS